MPLAGIERCPVCGARFRGTPSCSRCGADLGPLMSLAARAAALRNRARRALAAGNAETTGKLAHHADLLASHPSARALRLLAALMLDFGDTPCRPSVISTGF